MGAVTGKGLAELIREQYGVRWSLFATASVLIANLGICICEFVGIGAALGLAARAAAGLGADRRRAASGCSSCAGSYKVAERVFVLMTIPFFAYPIAAILAQPDWGDVGHAIVAPHVQLTHAYLFLFIATAGTTITPVHAALRPVGGRRARRRHRRAERRARRGASGSIFAEPRRELHHHRHRRDALRARRPHASTAPPTRRARSRRSPAATPRCCSPSGLLGASLLAAAILPVTAAYVDRGDVRLREGDQAPPARGARVRGRHHRPDRDRHARRGHPGPPRDRRCSSASRS